MRPSDSQSPTASAPFSLRGRLRETSGIRSRRAAVHCLTVPGVLATGAPSRDNPAQPHQREEPPWSGTVSFVKSWRVSCLRTGPPREPGPRALRQAKILKLSSNEHPSGPVPRAVEAMTAVLTRLNRYPDGGAVALRRKLADRLDVAFEQVAVGNGSNELIRLLAQVVLRPATRSCMPGPRSSSTRW